jgi:hypothetical protein
MAVPYSKRCKEWAFISTLGNNLRIFPKTYAIRAQHYDCHSAQIDSDLRLELRGCSHRPMRSSQYKTLHIIISAYVDSLK